MGKGLSHDDRARILAKEILDAFSSGEKLSLLLQRSAQLARLINDYKNQEWIDREIIGIFDEVKDLPTLYRSGRVWGKKEKQSFHFGHVDVLEDIIESQKIRLSAAKDPSISVSSANQYQRVNLPSGNLIERERIVESIRTNRQVLSTIRGELYQFVLNTFLSLNFTNIVSEIFSDIRANVEIKIAKYAPETVKEFNAIYENVSSKNQANWSNVASGARRVILKIADLVAPSTNEKVRSKSGEEIKLTGDKYVKRLEKIFKPKNGRSEDVLAYDTGVYVFELIDSVNRLYGKGDKNHISQELAKKIVIYTYLLLDEILERYEIQNKLDTDQH